MIEESYINLFEKETRYTQSHVKKLGYWFIRKPIEMQMDIFKSQKNYYFKLKHNKPMQDQLISVISLFQAINDFYQSENNINQKNKTMKMERILTKNYKEPRKKIIRDKLLNIWSEVQELRNSGASPEKVAKMAKSKHRFDISRQYIGEIWKEVEGVKYSLR